MSKAPFEFLKAKPKFNLNFKKPLSYVPSSPRNSFSQPGNSPSLQQHNENIKCTSDSEAMSFDKNPFSGYSTVPQTPTRNEVVNPILATPMSAKPPQSFNLSFDDPNMFVECLTGLSTFFSSYRLHMEKQILQLQGKVAELLRLENSSVTKDERIFALESQFKFLIDETDNSKKRYEEISQR